MKRTDILKGLAMFPAVGGLLSSPISQKLEAVATDEEPEVLSTTFAMMTRGGQYLEAVHRPAWPTLEDIEDAATHGFDRFEIWSNIRGVIYTAPTRLGVRPVGWWSATTEQLQGYFTQGTQGLRNIPVWALK